jgi:hypothetical protein
VVRDILGFAPIHPNVIRVISANANRHI